MAVELCYWERLCEEEREIEPEGGEKKEGGQGRDMEEGEASRAAPGIFLGFHSQAGSRRWRTGLARDGHAGAPFNSTKKTKQGLQKSP
jgi:hypothetical protein